MNDAAGAGAHCDACGAALTAAFRCARCRAVTASSWLASAALLLWLGALALHWAVSRVLYADAARVYEGLGAQPPLPARLHFALSEPAFYAIAALALLALPTLFVANRGKAGRLRAWTRRYAVSAGVGWAWALLGLGAWWLTVRSIVSGLT
jgi:hypothetical protein